MGGRLFYARVFYAGVGQNNNAGPNAAQAYSRPIKTVKLSISLKKRSSGMTFPLG